MHFYLQNQLKTFPNLFVRAGVYNSINSEYTFLIYCRFFKKNFVLLTQIEKNMKLFTKTLPLISALMLISFCSFGVSYVSAAAGPASWNVATTWTPNGIPTSSDDVTIAAGHTVKVMSTGCLCRNLTVIGTLNLTSNTLGIRGNYTVSGSETGGASILFNSTTTSTITITGSVSSSSGYSFNTNVVLASGSIIKGTSGSAAVTLAIGKTFTNNGTCTWGTFTGKTGSTFINAANATLSLRNAGFMTLGTFTANATGNSVNLLYTTGAVPNTSAGYYNLSLTSSTSGTKTLGANTIVAHNLTMNANNSLNSNNFNLTVGGNWVNNATFTASAGKTVTFNGTTAQTVSNTVGTTTFKNLAIDNTNGVTLTTGTYVLDETLTISNGTFNTGGRPFTMTSTATATARIAPITGTGAIAGNFTIQRFISARDTTFADLSSPVQSTTFNDWDNELPAISYTTAEPSIEPTQFTYDEPSDAYVPVSSAGTILTPGQGFEVFLAGDFSYSNFPATTITSVGVPNQGDQDLSGLVSDAGVNGWNLVGNPFASSVSWSAIYAASGGAASGLFDYIEMYDYTIGDWADVTAANEIPSTQGFWVYSDFSAQPTLIIPETAKMATGTFNIRSANSVSPYFTLKLANLDRPFAHVFKVASTSDASDGLDKKDIPFHASPSKATPAMYCLIDGKKMNINTFNASNETYSLPLVTAVTVAGNYKIEANGFDFISDYTCVQLEDRLLNKMIDLKAQNVYAFSMNTTDNQERFVLHFNKDGNNCKSMIASNSLTSDFAHQIEILPSAEGNTIFFNLSETENTTITVTNMLGQTITESISVAANNQQVNVNLPVGYSGMYLVKVESSKGSVTKKFVRK